MYHVNENYERRQKERRDGDERRDFQMGSEHWQEPSWADQRLQFFTRYFFAILGLIYLNYFFAYSDIWMPVSVPNIMLVCYLGWATALLWHAKKHPFSPTRYRLAMWVDVVYTSVIVLNDPFTIPITSLVYIVVVLGNGMRYGMRCFSEALVGSFFAAMLTLTLRYAGTFHDLSPGILFMNLFGAIIVIYAYVLMSRIDKSRRVLEHTSRLDLLTGIMNRAALLETGARILTMGADNTVVVFGDLDKFKAINDTRGHSEGDRCLAAVGKIIRTSIRQTDIAGRYGGDEFVLVLTDSDPQQAQEVADRIRNRIEAWGKRLNINLGISFGFALAPKHGKNLHTLLQHADTDLYRAKASQHSNSGLNDAVLNEAGTTA